MSGRLVGQITPTEPWGAPLPDPRPVPPARADVAMLQALAAERSPVECSYCHEAIVHDGEIWRHVRTGCSADWRSKDCHPLCRDCDREGLVAIGCDQFVGSGIRFVVSHFLCREHARRQPTIDRL